MVFKDEHIDRVIYILLAVILIALLLSPFYSLFRPRGESVSLQPSTAESILRNEGHGDFSVYASDISWLDGGQDLAELLNISAWEPMDGAPGQSAKLEIKLGDDYWLCVCDGYAYISYGYAYPGETKAYYSIPEQVTERVAQYIEEQTQQLFLPPL